MYKTLIISVIISLIGVQAYSQQKNEKGEYVYKVGQIDMPGWYFYEEIKHKKVDSTSDVLVEIKFVNMNGRIEGPEYLKIGSDSVYRWYGSVNFTSSYNLKRKDSLTFEFKMEDPCGLEGSIPISEDTYKILLTIVVCRTCHDCTSFSIHSKKKLKVKDAIKIVNSGESTRKSSVKVSVIL